MQNFDVVEYSRNWRLQWLKSLIELSNPKFQQRWIDKRITNPAWTYVEFMESYFGDLQLKDGYEKKIQEGFIIQNEYECIKDFHKALQQYQESNGTYDPAAILSDSNWLKIVLLGQESVSNLKKFITKPDEIIVLSGELPALTAGDFTWPKKPTWFRKLLLRINLPQF